MYKNYVIFFIAALIFTACDDDDQVKPNSCLAMEEADVIMTCSNLTTAPIVCPEIEYLGDVELSNKSLNAFPDFCRDVGDEIIFVNAQGETRSFEVQNKRRIRTASIANTRLPCSMDSTRFEQRCIGVEIAEIEIKDTMDNEGFRIILGNRVQLPSADEFVFMDYLAIDVYSPEDSIWYPEFEILIDQRTWESSEGFSQVEFPSLELNGLTFENVMSVEYEPHIEQYTWLYYNTTYGFIGFRHFDGELWRLQI